MMNLGGFVRGAFPEDQVGQLAFAPFPKIADIARFQDFSNNSVHIIKNGGDAGLPCLFLQARDPRPLFGRDRRHPARSDIKATDPLVQSAQASLKDVAGTAQYYDRDTDPDMAQAGLNGFQEFMAHPERRQAILRRLDGERKRVFTI